MKKDKDTEKPLSRKEKRKAKKEARLQKILSYGEGEDMKYRGPIGIRGLRVAAWILMMLSATSISLSIVLMANAVDDNHTTMVQVFTYLCSLTGALAVPSFMLAKFAIIFQKKRRSRDMLIIYGAITIVMELVFLLLYFHYGIHLLMAAEGVTYAEARASIDTYLTGRAASKISFNVFVDMFLWSAYFALIEIDIKDNSIGKRILRDLASSVPFLYVCVWFVIKALFAAGRIEIPVPLLPLVPTSTPVVFMAFIAISMFIRRRKNLYMRIGGTEEGYRKYLKTNANSFHFAWITAFCFLGAGIVDLICSLILRSFVTETSTWAENVISATGIGNSIAYILFVPFILLFSYTRNFKNDKIDLVITIVSIVIIALIVIEGGYYSALKWIVYFRDMLSG